LNTLAHAVAVMFGSDFLSLPVHPRGALIVDLHAIHADVALPGFRIARDHTGQGDKASSIFGPALQDREIQQREIIALDHLFARTSSDSLGKELAHLGQHRKHLYFVEKALRRLYVHEGADALRHFVKRVDFEGQSHATGGTELVDKKLRA